MLLRSLFILPIILFAVYSCDAPRLNPLDPQNPDYVDKQVAIDTTYTITGNVKTLAAPSAPIANVNVYWPNESHVTKTDADGNFLFEDINKSDGWLYFEKEEYFNDSVFVEWETDTAITVQRFLKFLPTAVYFSIYTEVENDYSKNTYKIGFETEILDKDGLVDSVIIQNDELKIYQPLTRQTFNTYGNIFKIGNLGLSSIESVVGRDFKLVFIDNMQHKIIATKEKVNRIINQEIDFIRPINKDTVSTTPTLAWTRFRPGFSFHYLVQVFTFEQVPVKIFERDNISSEDISLTISPAINNDVNGVDEYNWVIWCVDEFNNKSRSKPASFIVK